MGVSSSHVEKKKLQRQMATLSLHCKNVHTEHMRKMQKFSSRSDAFVIHRDEA